MAGAHTLDPKHQTNEEWLQEYTHGEHLPRPDKTSGHNKPRSSACVGISTGDDCTLQGEFSYQDHRTTKQGRVVLEFVHTGTGVLVAKFFNVDVKKYRTGDHGQFTVYPRHKFRKFWMHMIGHPPGKWCRVHQEMYKLKGLRYRGRATYRTGEKSGYWNLDQVRKS